MWGVEILCVNRQRLPVAEGVIGADEKLISFLEVRKRER